MHSPAKALSGLLLSIATAFSLHSQPLIRNTYHNYSPDSLEHLKVERVMIYTPEKEWTYAHHASITHFKNRFVAMWSNSFKDEDDPGQRVLFATSTDFLHWTTPQVLATPRTGKNNTANILTAAGFHTWHDTLVAYFGEYEKDRTHTQLWAKTSTDGIHWSEAINMQVPVNPNHGPQATASGRLIISGNICFPYTDDPSGLRGWKMSGIYPDSLAHEDNPATFYAPARALHLPPLCEGSFFQTDDGVLHMLLRVTSTGWKGRLWLTESKDNGASWSFPVETAFTDNDSKFHFGRFPNHRFYYVGNPDTLHHWLRNPLVLATSADGRLFGKQYILASEPYVQKQEGRWKNGQYGYPTSFLYKNYCYIIVSRQKEAIEVLRFKWKGL